MRLLFCFHLSNYIKNVTFEKYSKILAFFTLKTPSYLTFVLLSQDFCLFDLILYMLVNNFSVMSGSVFLGWTSTKQGLVCLAQGHNALTPVRLEPAALPSLVKHYTTEPLCSLVESRHNLLWKQWRSRSAGFIRSHLIRIHIVFHSD